MNNEHQIRERIQKLIILNGLSKAKFAEKIGFNKANLNLILSGKRKVPESLIFAIILNKFATFDYLVNGVESTLQGEKTFSDISSGGNTTTNNNGANEAQSLRADNITNKILDMLSSSFDGLSDIQARLSSMGEHECSKFASIEKRLDERTSLSDRLISLIEEKDMQLKEKDIQINKLLDLLSEKDK